MVGCKQVTSHNTVIGKLNTCFKRLLASIVTGICEHVKCIYLVYQAPWIVKNMSLGGAMPSAAIY